MCMAEENLHALLPADTQFPQQQLETQIGSQPERIAYKSLGQQSKKSQSFNLSNRLISHTIKAEKMQSWPTPELSFQLRS